MKKGPPTTAITMEAGISFGKNNVLPKVSASRNTFAPTIAQKGINFLWSEPTNNLEICGTINPKKLIEPTIAVAQDANIADRIEIVNLSKLELTPILLIVLSLRYNRLHLLLKTKEIIIPINTYGRSILKSSQVFILIIPSTIEFGEDIPFENA